MTLIPRIQNICLKPKQEWEVIAGETTSTAALLKNYALPLAAIGAVAGFIGGSFIGVTIPFVGTYRTPIGMGLAGAITSLVLAIVTVYVLSLIINALAPKFGGEKNAAQALKLAVYSSTPGWVAGAVRILPSLSLLAVLAGIYGLYVFYVGLPRLMKNPPDKSPVYTLAVVGCAIILGLVVAAVTGAIVGAGAMATGALQPGLH